jgi:chorismate mutase
MIGPGCLSETSQAIGTKASGDGIDRPPWGHGAAHGRLGGQVAVRAIRGAIQVQANTTEDVLAGSARLVRAVLERNELTQDQLISILFTATPDLTADFPAYAARQLGLTDVPLMCAVEIAVPGAMPKVIRLLAHVDTPRERSELAHVYLEGAAALRRDLPQ